MAAGSTRIRRGFISRSSMARGPGMTRGAGASMDRSIGGDVSGAVRIARTRPRPTWTGDDPGRRRPSRAGAFPFRLSYGWRLTRGGPTMAERAMPSFSKSPPELVERFASRPRPVSGRPAQADVRVPGGVRRRQPCDGAVRRPLGHPAVGGRRRRGADGRRGRVRADARPGDEGLRPRPGRRTWPTTRRSRPGSSEGWRPRRRCRPKK